MTKAQITVRQKPNIKTRASLSTFPNLQKENWALSGCAIMFKPYKISYNGEQASEGAIVPGYSSWNDW